MTRAASRRRAIFLSDRIEDYRLKFFSTNCEHSCDTERRSLEALLIGCGHRTRVSPRESWPLPRSLLQSFKRSELLRLPELALVFVCFDHVASVDYTRPYVYPHPLVTGASPTPSATPTPEEPLQKKRKEAKKKQTRQKMALPRRGARTCRRSRRSTGAWAHRS
jgi:hypothetical protein